MIQQLEFRNPDLLQVLAHREFLRNNLPNGSCGFVVEDLDLVIRVYGPLFGLDAIGKIRLIELKFGTAGLGTAQNKTFGLMDSLMRASDPKRKRYDGYYVMNYDEEDLDIAKIWINGRYLRRDEFLAFMRFERPDILPVSFPWCRPHFEVKSTG